MSNPYARLFLSFDGRIGRRTFWLCLLALIIACGLADAIDGDRFGTNDGPLSTAVGFLAMWPFFATFAKRCHDRGRSGLWSLLLFVPLLGFFWALCGPGLGRGEVGPNGYGLAPEAPPPFG